MPPQNFNACKAASITWRTQGTNKENVFIELQQTGNSFLRRIVVRRRNDTPGKLQDIFI